MAKLGKFFLIFVAALVGIGIAASAILYLFFDPNDFRDDISDGVRQATGRDLTIEGDLSLSIFPWVAIEIGHTRLGNTPGFGDEPFLSFDNARLSVQVLPLLLQREIKVGTASLDGFKLNLAVLGDGRNNWDDLSSAEEAQATTESSDTGGSDTSLDVQNISMSDATIVYSDAQANSEYSISGLSVNTGRVAPGEQFDFDVEFDFDSSPGELGGHLEISSGVLLSESMQQIDLDGLNVSGLLRGIVEQATELNFDARAMTIDTAAERVSLGEMDLAVLGLTMSANVEPFSIAGSPQPKMSLRVNEFSLKELMLAMGSEPPQTADDQAMQKVSFNANAAVGETAIAMTGMELKLDDTTMTGSLSLPMTETGALTFDLVADSINLDSYMAPASEADAASSDAESSNVEIPVDLIRSLHANGNIRLNEAYLSGMKFENMQLGVNSAEGRLRLHPVTADLFAGKYEGDVRIDASGNVPTLSVNENIRGVSLTPLAQSMFEQDNIAGTINGSFVLSGSGADVDAIRRDLDGTIAFELIDGEWQGTDVWQQLRSARAAFRGEAPPPARVPARTEFTSVTATGTVNDGVFSNNDFLAELPFLQMTGNGTVNLVAASIDYTMQARVLEQPEFVDDVTEAELKDFTAAVIPLNVTGPLASPSVRPDIEALVRAEVDRQVEEKKDELVDSLMDRVFGGGESTQEESTEQENDEEQGDQPPEEEQSPEDQVKDALKSIFNQ